MELVSDDPIEWAEQALRDFEQQVTEREGKEDVERRDAFAADTR